MNDLLDAAQMKAGKFELQIKSFDIFALIQEVISTMKVQCRTKRINLVVNIDEQLR